jgi:hypothetical protein
MEGVMQWPGITPARLNNAVAPQGDSRPFGPQGNPSDDFFPGAPGSGISAVCVSMAATPHCIGGRPGRGAFTAICQFAGRAVEQADLRCRLVT